MISEEDFRWWWFFWWKRMP